LKLIIFDGFCMAIDFVVIDFAASGGRQLHTGPNRIGIQVGLALVEELQFTRQVNA
jgi:hypothetical protein